MRETGGTIFLNMENGSTIKMNGYLGGDRSFMNGHDGIKALSNSKMSLQSLRSNTSLASVGNKVHLNNGYASSQSIVDHFEEKKIQIALEPSDKRFGFSVIGGIDQGFLPKIDNITPDSAAERAGLYLDDEIFEVNGANVEQVTHADIIMQIHNCIKTITLSIRRYFNDAVENGVIHEMGIDIPASYQDNNNSYIKKTNGEPSSQTKVDGMLKFASRLHPKAEANRDSNIPARFVNEGFIRDNDDLAASMERLDVDTPGEPNSLAFSTFVAMLETMKSKLKTQKEQDDMYYLNHLLNTKYFKSAIKTHNCMTKLQLSSKGMDILKPVATNSQFLLTEVRLLLMGMTDPNSLSVLEIINKPDFKELLNAHDHIAMRESLDTFPEIEGSEPSEYDPEDLEDMISDEQRVKIVRIDKTNDPLGATVRNEGDAVIISRIVKGGAAEKSGLLHEGDEILEINNNSVKGKHVNEVVELLVELEGTLTFVLIPSLLPHKETIIEEDLIVMKALFDYVPSTDDYLPCEELGLNFMKGDVLEILNQNDPDWWQARFLDGKQEGLAGLIPSKPFQIQRELAKITLKGEDKEPILKEKKKCFCGRARRKGKKVPMKSKNAPVEESEIRTYEDMVRIYPDRNKKRPLVLIGPPQVGRRELRERLIATYPGRFSAAVPHTTRVPNPGEMFGIDYTFVTRATFEKSIAAAEFIEHGIYDGHYYGTSFSAVRRVVQEGKTCLLNMHCQALAVLKSSNLLPYVVFITVPRIDQLKRLREFDDTAEPFNPNVRLKNSELDDMIEEARSMNRTYGHYFDRTIINSDLDQAFDELVDACDFLETQPQWVLSSWVR